MKATGERLRPLDWGETGAAAAHSLDNMVHAHVTCLVCKVDASIYSIGRMLVLVRMKGATRHTDNEDQI